MLMSLVAAGKMSYCSCSKTIHTNDNDISYTVWCEFWRGKILINWYWEKFDKFNKIINIDESVVGATLAIVSGNI